MKRRQILAAVLMALLAAALLMTLGSAAGSSAKWPAKVSSSLKKNGKLSVDANNITEGYFQAAVTKKTNKRLKLRVVKDKTTLDYDLNGNAEFEVFPLQLGSGKYVLTLYEQVSGSKYSSAGSVSLNAKLSSEEVCFLYPNQYVNYTKKTAAVDKAEELCGDMKKQNKYETICNYVKTNFVYDYIKALNIKKGEMPDIDGCWKKKMGICQDLSALMCCMLRTQGLPARLMIGYADKNYHAWIAVTIGNKEYVFDPTVAVNGIGKVKKYTLERFY